MTEAENTWQFAKDEYENVILPKLARIGLDSKSETRYDVEIIRLSNMLREVFDPMVVMLLSEILKNYEDRKCNLE